MSEYLPIQSHYHAHRLTASATAEDAFTRSLTSARVEMNPHQVDAALFALKAPYAKGVLLADEVGLGKTIEAGLVISQKWAEQKRRILLIVPASLRKQWQQELFDKFSLRSQILEARTYNDLKKGGQARPFEVAGSVLISSYEFAARKADEIRAIHWDLVVFDEAHRLRNVYRKNTAKGAKALKEAVDGTFKILLTATPLQNSLMELFGIVSMIDDTHFGGENAFRTQYVGNATPAAQEILRERLSSICHRTLRGQVQKAGHINFRQRHARTFTFEPQDQETRLYEMLSEYLQDTGTIAYGGRTNALVVLQARKSLGSSTYAVASYLDTLLGRLRIKQRASSDMTDDFEDSLAEQSETLDGDEAGDDEQAIDPVKLAAEIVHVEAMRDLARSIGTNAKGEKLVHSLPTALDEIEGKGGKRKAVIFTESVRTQRYLTQLLTDNGYDGRIVLMNGSNNDDESRKLYGEWKDRHAGTDRISGSKTADMKAAIVEAFRSDEKSILIATESGAEGINLQFCSLLINYDLPWNPQRVEQRIGRCHRYGQLVDVTVVNMLNLKNHAEARIHELLKEKLHLFEGVFGASDEVLGILTDGIDFEKEVLRIVQSCRTREEAEREFDELTARIQDSINSDVEQARAKVLENMDGDVVANLHRRGQALDIVLPEFKRRLLTIAKAELPDAIFPQPDSEDFSWDGRQWTTKWPLADENDWQFFRANEGLGNDLIERAKARTMNEGAEVITFDPAAYAYAGQLGGVVELAGQSGWLRAFKAIMPTPGAEREEIIVVGESDGGEMIPPLVCDKMMLAPALSDGRADDVPTTKLSQLQDFEFGHFSERMKQDNYKWLIDEDERLNRYARDMEIEIESQIAALDAELKDLQRQKLSPSLSMEEKVTLMREVKKKNDSRDELKMSQFEVKKQIGKEITDKLDAFSELLNREPRLEELFTVRWTVEPGAIAATRAKAAQAVIPEFGQSPISLELDLDSYEGSWTHVAGFRGQSGWLLIARAVIQSEHDLLPSDLVVACDEHHNPIPSWRATHLTQCRWDRLDHCHEEPPEILDDLLCEEEGAFYARWQRQMNSGLAVLYDRAQKDIEALEARASARTRALNFQIAELRRRRRMVEASEDARTTIAAIIAELEAEQDQVTTRLAHRRSALRREADAAEEALWQRTDILIEVEPLRLVRWRAKSDNNAVRLVSPEQPGSGGISLLGTHRSDLRAVAQRRAKEALEAARRAEAARAAALEKQLATDTPKASSRPTQTAKPHVTGRSDLPKASPALRKLAAAASQPAPIIVVAPPPLLPIATKAAQQPEPGKLVIERDMLVGMLEALEARGQRLFSGSPKYRRNVEQRAELARQIAALDAKVAGVPLMQALPIISVTEDQPNAWPMDRVDMLKRLWSQGMSAADIGRAIGGVSRNAVIGKAKRLGLPMQAKADMGGRQSAENELAAKL